MADSPVSDLQIKSHSGPYTVKFAPLFSGLEGGLKPNEHLIIDERVADLYSEKLSAVLKDDSVLVLAAVETSKSYIPGLANTAQTLTILKATIPLWQSSKHLGYNDEATWQSMEKFMIAEKMIAPVPDLTQAYTNKTVV